MLQNLIIIADDYGISPGVSCAIRDLAAAGRLSGSGVMATMPHWPAEAPALRAVEAKLAIGLHFTLTDQMPLGAMPQLAPGGKLPSVGQLLKRSLQGAIPAAEIEGELERQMDRFEAHFGRPPDFIDGHQHVQVLPGIWPVVQKQFGRRLDPAKCWLRDCHDPAFWKRTGAFKAGLVSFLGGAASRAAKRAGLRTNRGFSGFYDPARGDWAHFLAAMLRGARDGHAIMVHPGHVDQALRDVDTLTEPREAEWAALIRPDFPDILARLGFAIAPPAYLVDAGREISQTAAP